MTDAQVIIFGDIPADVVAIHLTTDNKTVNCAIKLKETVTKEHLYKMIDELCLKLNILA